jgi:hypothetical protein
MRKTYDPHGATNSIIPPTEYALDRTHAYKEAERHGLDVVEADDYTLQLDMDRDEAFQMFIDFDLGRLISFLYVERVWWTESRGGNKHVYIRLTAPRTLPERIALQASLGSDPVREFLNLMRYNNGSEKPVLFFEKPNAPQVVIYATDGYQPQLGDGEQVKGLLTNGTKFPFGTLQVLGQ